MKANTMADIKKKKIKLCMISTFPPECGGVSTYTENLVDSLYSSIETTIIAQKNGDSREESKVGVNISIVNCWKTGLFYPFQIFKELCARKPQIVHIQHEYFIFGRAISAGIFPLVTIFAKILRVKVFVTMHGVVNPVEIKDPELNSIGNESLNGIPRTFSQAGLLLITRLIYGTSDKIIVMNNVHRNVLMHEYHCLRKQNCDYSSRHSGKRTYCPRYCQKNAGFFRIKNCAIFWLYHQI